MCHLGQVVKTLASHAGIRGSTPLGDTNEKIDRTLSYLCFILRFQSLGESNQKGLARHHEHPVDGRVAAGPRRLIRSRRAADFRRKYA